MRPLLGFSFICFIFQIMNSHLSQPSPFWSLQQLSPYTLSVCVRNIRYLFSPSVSKYQNIEDVSHFTTQNFTSTEHYTQRYIHFNAFQFSQKILSKCNCFIRKSEHSYVTMVLTVANQYVHTLMYILLLCNQEWHIVLPSGQRVQNKSSPQKTNFI